MIGYNSIENIPEDKYLETLLNQLLEDEDDDLDDPLWQDDEEIINDVNRMCEHDD
jgi:hypothetical protein